MLTQIRKIFQNVNNQPSSNIDIVQKKRIAACVLLLEAAHADDECTPEEMARIVELVKTRFSLSPEHTTELLEIAARERQNSVDLWSFTNDLNQQLSKKEKLEILKDVWEIIFADGHLECHEDHLAHKLANLLRLTHEELIEAKIAAKASI